jgi:hypothetical protein
MQLKGNTAATSWKQQLWPPSTSWHSYLTSQFKLLLWTEGPNTTHKSVTWWDHIRTSACTSIPELDAYGITPELLPKDWTFCGSWTQCFLLWFLYYYSCIINFTITILLSLFLPSSLSLLLLCYNPFFSFPTKLSTPYNPLLSQYSPLLPILTNLSPH